MNWSNLLDSKNVNDRLKRGGIVKLNIKKITQSSIYLKPEFYNLAYPHNTTRDENFYKAKASKGNILYLGVGTGRIFSKLVRENPQITGLDSSKKMIQFLVKKLPETRKKIQLGNALDRELFPENFFDVIIAPHSFVTHFNRSSAKKLFKNIARWLKNDGKFLTDIFSPLQNPKRIGNDEMEIFNISNRKPFPFLHLISYKKHVKRLCEYLIFKSRTKYVIYKVSLRYYYPGELQKILKQSGFSHTTSFPDFKEKKSLKNCKTVAFLCSRT